MPSVDPIQEAKDKADKEAAAAAVMVSSCAAMPHTVQSLTLSLLSHNQEKRIKASRDQCHLIHLAAASGEVRRVRMQTSLGKLLSF